MQRSVASMHIFRMLLGALSDALDEHAKRVEERGEAYLTSIGKIQPPQTENRPAETPPEDSHSLAYRSSAGAADYSSSQPSANDYRACHKRSWAAGNKMFTWDDWHYATKDHPAECTAALTIPAKQQWRVNYEDAAAASQRCQVCWVIATITRRYSSRLGGEDSIIVDISNPYHIPSEYIGVSSMTLTRQGAPNQIDQIDASQNSSIHVRLHYPEPSQLIAG